MKVYITKYALTSGVIVLTLEEEEQIKLRDKGYIFVKQTPNSMLLQFIEVILHSH